MLIHGCLSVSVCLSASPPTSCVCGGISLSALSVSVHVCLSDYRLSDSQSFIQPLAQCSLCGKDIRNKKTNLKIQEQAARIMKKNIQRMP